MLDWLLFRSWTGSFFCVQSEKTSSGETFDSCTNRNYVLTEYVLNENDCIGFQNKVVHKIVHLTREMQGIVGQAPRFSAAGMVRMKIHEKSGWVHLI